MRRLLPGRNVVGVRLALAAAVSLAAVGCGQEAKQTASVGSGTHPPLPRLGFGYDRSSPLGFHDRGVVTRIGAVQVEDVVYASGGLQVQGYLVQLAGRARRPGVVLVPGSGGDRGELLGDAVVLARMGAVALTITEPSTSNPLPAPTTYSMLLSESQSSTVRDVVAVRRAADVLASLSTVDSRRLGYLGWSAGAKTGAFVAASDPRFRALVLLSAGAAKLSAFVSAAPTPIRPQVRRELGLVDPLRYVAYARSGTLLLEDGTRDAIVPHGALENMVAAAPRGTIVRWYAAGHALDALAYRQAFSWLLTKLAAARG